MMAGIQILTGTKTTKVPAVVSHPESILLKVSRWHFLKSYTVLPSYTKINQFALDCIVVGAIVACLLVMGQWMPTLLLISMLNFSWRCFGCHEEVKKRYGYDSGYYEQINETDSIILIKTQNDLCDWGLCVFQTLSQQQRFHIEEFSPVYLSACVWPRKLISYLVDEVFYRSQYLWPRFQDREIGPWKRVVNVVLFHFCSTSHWRWFTLFFLPFIASVFSEIRSRVRQ